MPQERYFDYFTDATSGKFNATQYVLHSKGVYTGMDLLVDTGKLYITSGYAMQHNGVVWYESTDISLDFSPPALATNYTIVATHDNRSITGGVGVQYTVQAGSTLKNSDIPNGIVMGWIYHPGGTATLLQEHVLSAPKSKTGDYSTEFANKLPIELIPAYPQSIVTSKDIDIVFTPSAFDPVNFVIYQSVKNNSLLATETMIQQFQFYVTEAVRPYSFDFYFKSEIAGGSNMVVEVHGTSMLTVPIISGSPVLGNASNTFYNRTVMVHRTDGTFTAGYPYTLRLTYNVAPGKEIQTGRIKANFWQYP